MTLTTEHPMNDIGFNPTDNPRNETDIITSSLYQVLEEIKALIGKEKFTTNLLECIQSWITQNALEKEHKENWVYEPVPESGVSRD